MNHLFNLKSFFQFLSRNKIYTIIDVFGLSVSLMFVILIAVYTSQELSTDRFQTNADRICIVTNEASETTAVPVAYRLQERYPEIEYELCADSLCYRYAFSLDCDASLALELLVSHQSESAYLCGSRIILSANLFRSRVLPELECSEPQSCGEHKG